MSQGKKILSDLADDVRDNYEHKRRQMSFHEFMDEFAEHPRRHARNAVQYMRDCFLHYGTEKKPEVWGDVTHFKMFDVPFDDGADRLVGQERAQERVFRMLDNFVRQGQVNKLLLLHGPNGSAKSTFIDVIMRALEAYSETDEGALYKFNWVFPNERLAAGSSIGFEGFSARTAEETDLETFAYLDEEEIDAKIPSELKDHPLLLIPGAQRAALLDEHIDQLVRPRHSEESGEELRTRPGDDGEDGDQPFVASNYILRGDLSHTSRQIFDALLTAYRGDLEKVFKHVQIERFFISRRYRAGAVVVEPQMRVDANLRQLTVDRSLSALPSSLQNQTIFEPFGDLVDANRGIIEYDDLLKRQPELNKYLLATSEKGSVSLENRILHLDMVLMATGNEDYLDAFKQTPDYSSFKGRIELVRLPYLLDYTVEEVVYDQQVSSVDFIKHLAPHTTMIAALWATLTRLTRPDPDSYGAEVRDIISTLTPLEKADLYARGKVPDNTAPESARELKRAIPKMMSEGEGSSEYEGRQGASPREMKMILLNASQNDDYPCLSPLAVFEEMDELVKDPSVFPFLQMKPNGDFHRHDQFIQTVKDRYLDVIDSEIRGAMGLVEEGQYEELFRKYIDHVSQWLKGEKVYNPITDEYEEPDQKLMEDMEERLNIEEDVEEVRKDLISSIAAYSIDHPGEKVDYREVFPQYFEALQEKFYGERVEQIRRIEENLLEYFEEDSPGLSDGELQTVETTLENLRTRYGYCDECAREAVAFLLSNRYNQ